MWSFKNIILILMLWSSVQALISNNLIISVIFLILLFLLGGFLFIYFGCEFLAIFLIIVYMGALAILFIFVVMMIDLKFAKIYMTIYSYLSFFWILLIFFEFFLVLAFTPNGILEYTFESYKYIYIYKEIFLNFDIVLFGIVLYSYLYPMFIIVGFVLLISIIGAILLTVSPREIKKQTNYSEIKFWT